MGTDGLPSSASISGAFMLMLVEAHDETGPRRSAGRLGTHLWVGVRVLLNETELARRAGGGRPAHLAGMLRACRATALGPAEADG